MSLTDIAFEVCSALRSADVAAVLVGGSAAAFHAPNALMTRDLDFVLHLELFGLPERGAEALRLLGFKSTNTAGTLSHEDITYTLEILSGPLAIGAEQIRTWDTHTKGDRVLHTISATDSVKDRLGHAIHFKDLSAARQAAEIAKVHPIDLAAVRTWCTAEGSEATYTYFEAFLHA